MKTPSLISALSYSSQLSVRRQWWLREHKYLVLFVVGFDDGDGQLVAVIFVIRGIGEGSCFLCSVCAMLSLYCSVRLGLRSRCNCRCNCALCTMRTLPHPYPLEQTPQFRPGGGMVTKPPPASSFPQYNQIRKGYGIDREHPLAYTQSLWTRGLGSRTNAGTSTDRLCSGMTPLAAAHC